MTDREKQTAGIEAAAKVTVTNELITIVRQRVLVEDGDDKLRKALQAAITAYLAAEPQQTAEPVGWVLVPREPKPEMLAAWYRYKSGHHWPEEPPPRDTSDYGAYRAMIAAAPVNKDEPQKIEPVAYAENDSAEWFVYWPETDGTFEHIGDYPAFHKDVTPLFATPTSQADLINRLASFMISKSLATGHGDTFDDLLRELGSHVDELRTPTSQADLFNRLVKALKPFAKYIEKLDEWGMANNAILSDDKLFANTGSAISDYHFITYGDLRALRAALSQATEAGFGKAVDK